MPSRRANAKSRLPFPEVIPLEFLPIADVLRTAAQPVSASREGCNSTGKTDTEVDEELPK